MNSTDHKAILQHYLGIQRTVFLTKLEGLSERQARTPITGTGTNILGVVKHAVGVECGYLSDVFGRPSQVETPWYAEDAEDNDDMWATAEQDIPWMLDFCERVWAQSDATIAALDLDAPGQVPWWREGEVTLHLILVHVIAEYARHAGHLDIARELLDGQIGWKQESPVLPDWESRRWVEYVDWLKELAEASSAEPVSRPARADGV